MSGPQIRRSQAVSAARLRDRTNKTSATDYITNTSADAQRNRLLAYLKHGSITTIDARRSLNVFQPAARVFELRHRGYNIVTHLMDSHDDLGRPHIRVALYSLIAGGAK